MSTLQEQTQAAALKVIQAGVADLIPLAEAAEPLPLDLLTKGLLALPPIQSLIADGENAVADEIGTGVAAIELKLQAEAGAFLKNHPLLAALWAKLEPILPSVGAELKILVTPELQKLFSTGDGAKAYAFLKSAGVV